ncbi:MAG: pantoate kinase [Candidatus Thermoplasmatota archaeon]|jgi:pantoate kinase|nr:pantoate kinase [Candidatus Thermoplasmatota archaeon]
MKVVAFAPGHISGFFEPVFVNKDLTKTGSRGAGINISLGAVSEVVVENSTKQDIEIFINNKKSDPQVTRLAIKYLIGEKPLKVVARTKLDLPVGQGFGMSAAGTLSSSIALAKSIGSSRFDAIRAAHCAEVQLRTGLGDVLASSFGGIEIRREAGLPPWGLIEHIPGRYEIVLCVVGKKIDTKNILSDEKKIMEISEYGKYCIKKLLEKPSVENLFRLSQFFAKKIKLAEEKVIEAIEAANHYGMASMCMLGNSVFAVGDTNKIFQTLSTFGETYVCTVDEQGARVLE